MIPITIRKTPNKILGTIEDPFTGKEQVHIIKKPIIIIKIFSSIKN
jgi:hypothetical protein